MIIWIVFLIAIIGAFILSVVWIAGATQSELKAFNDAVAARDEPASTGHAVAQIIGAIIILGLTFAFYEATITPPYSSFLSDHPNLIWITAAFLIIYFLPSIVAVKAKRKNALPIMALNILLGWTFLGWLGSLIWALMPPKDDPPVIAPVIVEKRDPAPQVSVPSSDDIVEKLAKAAELHSAGRLSDAEFGDLKKRLLASS